MPEPICPACGESQALTGRPVEGDIVITCGRCGAEWERGAPRCKRCGREGGTSAPQQMTRHPRGTLLAVVGVRQTLLCSDCDSEVLADFLERRKPVPEGYVSQFLYGGPRKPASQPAPQPTRKPRSAKSSSAVARPAPAAKHEPPPVADPTLRQATEAFLGEAGAEASSLTMVLLGSKLGPSTRLSHLDTEATAGDLQRWVAETFASREDQREAAVRTLKQATRYWLDRGWLTRDLTVGL